MPKSATARKLTIQGSKENDSIVFTSAAYSFNGTITGVDPALVLAGVVINGNSGNDTLTGWDGPDELNGGQGNDTLRGGDGYDILSGGAGNDTLIDDWLGAFFDGGLGLQDTLDLSGATRGVGLDLANGVVFPNFVIGDPDARGQVIVTGTFGSTQLVRISGVENVTGGAWNDYLLGSDLDNRIEGGGGNDIIAGRPGNDSIDGGPGNDEIHGGLGDDLLYGGTGADRFVYLTFDGQDVIFDFNKSEDTIEGHGTGTLTWSTTTFNTVPSTVGIFPDGTSFVLVGITDPVGVVVNYFG